MNRLIFIYLLVCLTGMFACKPSVTFTEPQPSGADNLSKIPGRLQGMYISPDDHSLLKISDRLMERTLDSNYTFTRKSLDSNEVLLGNTIVDLKTGEKFPVKIVGDNLIYHVRQCDTLFELTDSSVIRKFRGYYFLNNRYGKDAWSVRKAELSKGTLTISRIVSKSDLEKLDIQKESPRDTLQPPNFRITKKQFKEILKRDVFKDNETFIRLGKKGTYSKPE